MDHSFKTEQRRKPQVVLPPGIEQRREPPQSEFSGKFGPWTWKLLGYDLTPIMLFAALCGLCYIFYITLASLRGDHKEILEAMRDITELQAETNYINSRPIDKRPELPMPMSLFCKINPTDERCYAWKRSGKNNHDS